MSHEDKIRFLYSNRNDTSTKDNQLVQQAQLQEHRYTKENWDSKKFLIYAHSHCVGIRQKAFRQIVNYVVPNESSKNNEITRAYYGGSCNGGIKDKSKAQKLSNSVKLSSWENNRFVYNKFRFCLTMEHVDAPGYITEKILLAYWSQCIPIYYGTTEIFQIFHYF